MPIPVTVPELGESVSETTIGRWLKAPGEPVTKDEPLLELQSDKVTAEVVAPASGVLQTISATEGETVSTGAVIALIALENEAVDGAADAPAPVAPSQPQAESEASAQPSGDRSPVTTTEPAEIVSGERLYTPRVRQLAAEHGLTGTELASITGSGLGGRLTANDVQTYLRDRPTVAAIPTAPVTSAPPTTSGAATATLETPASTTITTHDDDDTLLPLTPMRRAIATHMSHSVRTAPQVWGAIEIDMSAVARVRAATRAAFEMAEGFSLTYLPFFASAVISALRSTPVLNATWEGDALTARPGVNLGVAVAVEGGLVVPVIPGADSLNLTGLARAIRDRAERARANRLTGNDLSGGTITVNNTGAFGSILSRPIINQPQVAIVTMEAIVSRVVVVDADAIAIRPLMNACLTYDERAVDASSATTFLGEIKRQLEHWPSMGTE